MVSLHDSQVDVATALASTHTAFSNIQRPSPRSMRTIRSTIFQTHHHRTSRALAASTTVSSCFSDNLTDSVVDMRLNELAFRPNPSEKSSSLSEIDFLELSRAFSDISTSSSGSSCSDMSGELERLARLHPPCSRLDTKIDDPLEEPCAGFLERQNFSTEIIESISPEDLLPTVKICVDGLQSPSVAVKRSAAAKLRLLAKNRSDNRALIGESGAVPALIPLLRCSDPCAQEHAVTALLNLSLHEGNKSGISNAGAVKALIYVLKTGTEVSKQNAACTLLSLSLVDENKRSIGACGAIPPLVSLLLNGSNRGKKDALTTLYKLCSVQQNKERAVRAGAVRPLIELISEEGGGLKEKAMVVLSSLACIRDGKEAIVEVGGIPALVEAIEGGSAKGKEFAVLTLLQLCAENIEARGLLVREGGIPPLVALSQTGSARAKHKVESLLVYLREPREESSSPSASHIQR